ncbi:ATP-binding protein [Streptomyces sp. NPDC005373]|uniref:ATP-binding protein n=1 Tax=Streptomyces sp. NPDC005373 TaxID=3156879 RepID=UPI0033BC8AF3
MAQWNVSADDQGSALLVVVELAADAAQHGGSRTAIRLSLTGRTLSIEVADSGEHTADSPVRHPSAHDEHGRGLKIVACLADRVAITPDQ